MVYADQIEPPIRALTYPEDLERWIELKSGSRLFLRPLKLTDEALLRDLFYKLSPESIHYRFFEMIQSTPHKKLQEFLRIDYDADMALVALTGSREEDAEMVAIAHYLKEPRSNFAETAFLVRDDWQGKGIGTQLMQALLAVARRHGIAGFTADVLADNRRMMHVFHSCGYAVESRLEGNVYTLRIPFQA